MGGTWVIEIVVAIIGAIAVVSAAILPIVIGLQKARKENRDQHAENKEALLGLVGKVDVVHDEVRDMRKDFTRHLENHNKEK